MSKKSIGIKIAGGSAIFFGVGLIIILATQWTNLIAQYTLMIAFVYTIYGSGLVASGVGILNLKNWGRISLMVMCGLSLFCLAINVALSAFIPDAITPFTILVLLWPLTLFTLPLIYLTRPAVREFFGVLTN